MFRKSQKKYASYDSWDCPNRAYVRTTVRKPSSSFDCREDGYNLKIFSVTDKLKM